MAQDNTVTIIGGGIVGLATARAITRRFPRIQLTIVEKESEVAMHQTGHNSGVVHSGIYYAPGSLKATLCLQGREELLAFCADHNIPYNPIGKVIVATHEKELSPLQKLHERGIANGIPGVRLLTRDELNAIEPHVNGIAAVHCPKTGILDYSRVCRALAEELEQAGAHILKGTMAQGIHQMEKSLVVSTTQGDLETCYLINCAGLYSDVVARWMLPHLDVRIIPFRGEYYDVHDTKFVNGLIYPVPDPQFPFLGVHLTRMIDGGLEAGPSAVLGFAREGYTKTTIQLGELWEIASFRGMWKIARKYWRMGLYEFYRSVNKSEFVRSIQKLVPSITSSDVSPGGAGVRAQAVRRDGTFLDDFAFAETARSLHVLNAPSPAATASLAIGHHIVRRAEEALEEIMPH
jgi:(S)-2-hydroxyglutarate dehydrogenase